MESKDDKDEKVTMLKKKIAEEDAAIKKLVKAITENNDKVAEIKGYMEQETELRNENHAEIEATIKDSQDAQAAVTQATQVLKDFYKESGMIAKEPWEFVQLSASRGVDLPDSPDTWDSSYTGVTDPENGADGVLALLDGVMEKFSAMEADAKVQDETDQQNYEKDMQAKKISLEDRKKARADEITALRKAQTILEDAFRAK